jgi:hypothetical protein
MPNRFEKFVHDENIRSFTRQIETEVDPVGLAMLKTLLKSEQARHGPPRDDWPVDKKDSS